MPALGALQLGQRWTNAFASAVVDALGSHIAILDMAGTIVAVNEAWRQFAIANTVNPHKVSEGANYIAVCEVAAAEGDEDARRMLDIIRRVASGASRAETFEYPCHSPTEERWFTVGVRRFRAEQDNYLVVWHENITARRKSEAEARHLALHDHLTGLPNRRLIEERANALLTKAESSGRDVAVVFLDVDNLKYANDAYGHFVGDAVIQAVAEDLRAAVRGEDLVARMGGDEFIVVLADLDGDGKQLAEKRARQILGKIRTSVEVDAHSIPAGASAGVAVYPYDGASFEELARHADAAMYEAKRRGRGSVQFYSGRLGGEARIRVVLEREIRRAVEQKEFEVFYQPQLSMLDRSVVAMEALVRWRHPLRGLLMPGAFIGAAEEIGMIAEIDRFVLNAAAAQRRMWGHAGLPAAVPVAVNVSPVELLHEGFLDFLAAIEEVDYAAGTIELELTERVAINDGEIIAARLTQLRERGFGIAIDDFGSGYSNLGVLQRLPVDRIKIDRQFVSELPDKRAEAIIRAITALGHTLGLKVVAEGVETEAQWDLLQTIGCDHAQGFLISRPLPEQAATAWLAEHAAITV